MRGWALYLGNLWDLNSSMEDIPGQWSSVGVPAEGGGGDIQSTLLKVQQPEGSGAGGGFYLCHHGCMPGLMRLRDRIKFFFFLQMSGRFPASWGQH